MYAPGGIASILMLNLRVAKYGLYGRIWSSMSKIVVASLIAATGLVIAIEMLYQRTLESTQASEMKLFGIMVDTANPGAWLSSALLIAIGIAGFLRYKNLFSQQWSAVNTEIEDQMRRAIG